MLCAAAFAVCGTHGTAVAGLAYVVDSTGDGDLVGPSTICDDGTGHCTLRAAIEASNLHPGTDGIFFDISTTDPGYSHGTWTIINLPALANISDSVNISGPGADKLTVQRSTADGTPDFRVFNVTTSGTVNLSDVTKASGTASNDTGSGTLTAGTAFTVINNTSASLISGRFSNLANDATFISNGTTFKAKYKGGDGNDLILTVQ